MPQPRGELPRRQPRHLHEPDGAAEGLAEVREEAGGHGDGQAGVLPQSEVGEAVSEGQDQEEPARQPREGKSISRTRGAIQ